MVVDTSAVIAILRKEPEGEALLRALMSAPSRLMSALTVLEAYMVSEGSRGQKGGAELELFLFRAGIEIVPFDANQAEAARMAWRKFGKGNHPAGLNLGDCCAYALARVTGEPVLCKGADFAQTDIAVVELP